MSQGTNDDIFGGCLTAPHGWANKLGRGLHSLSAFLVYYYDLLFTNKEQLEEWSLSIQLDSLQNKHKLCQDTTSPPK